MPNFILNRHNMGGGACGVKLHQNLTNSFQVVGNNLLMRNIPNNFSFKGQDQISQNSNHV